jgi:Ankyrin repeats (3 copies)
MAAKDAEEEEGTDEHKEFVRAIWSHRVEPVEAILATGVDVNEPIIEGYTPLYVACGPGKLATLELLLRHGADVNKAKPDNGYVPLFAAMQNASKEVVEYLLDQGADVRHGTVFGQTALHILLSRRNWMPRRAPHSGRGRTARGARAAARGGNRRRGRGKRMLPPGQQQNKPPQVLHMPPSAVVRNLVDLTKMLLDHGADPNALNSAGESPASLAAAKPFPPDHPLPQLFRVVQENVARKKNASLKQLAWIAIQIYQLPVAGIVPPILIQAHEQAFEQDLWAQHVVAAVPAAAHQ